MPGWLKKAIWLVIVAFILFYVFTRPEAAAGAVRTFIGSFESVVRFFESLVP